MWGTVPSSLQTWSPTPNPDPAGRRPPQGHPPSRSRTCWGPCAFLGGAAHLDGGDPGLQAHQDSAALQRRHARVLHAGVRRHEVGHVQQPVGAEQVREAAAAVQRVGREGREEAHARALVLQAAAPGPPLRLLPGRRLGLRRPAGKGRPGAGRQRRPRLPPRGPAPFLKPRPQAHLLGQALHLQALSAGPIPDWCLYLSIKLLSPPPSPPAPNGDVVVAGGAPPPMRETGSLCRVPGLRSLRPCTLGLWWGSSILTDLGAILGAEDTAVS